jgi:hypothetical protein
MEERSLVARQNGDGDNGDGGGENLHLAYYRSGSWLTMELLQQPKQVHLNRRSQRDRKRREG